MIERKAYVLTDDGMFLTFNDNGSPLHTSYRFAHFFEDNDFGLRTARSHLPRIPTAKILQVTFKFDPVD